MAARLREAAEWLWQCHDALMRGEDDPGIGDAWNALRAALAADREPETDEEYTHRVMTCKCGHSRHGSMPCRQLGCDCQRYESIEPVRATDPVRAAAAALLKTVDGSPLSNADVEFLDTPAENLRAALAADREPETDPVSAPDAREKRCEICGDPEPFHVHDGDRRIEDYFTVGRGQTDFEAAQVWRARALAADREPEPVQVTDEMARAFLELYESAVQVVDVTNPNLKRERKRLSLRLDRWEGLRAALSEPPPEGEQR